MILFSFFIYRHWCSGE